MRQIIFNYWLYHIVGHTYLILSMCQFIEAVRYERSKNKNWDCYSRLVGSSMISLTFRLKSAVRWMLNTKDETSYLLYIRTKGQCITVLLKCIELHTRCRDHSTIWSIDCRQQYDCRSSDLILAPLSLRDDCSEWGGWGGQCSDRVRYARTQYRTVSFLNLRNMYIYLHRVNLIGPSDVCAHVEINPP